MHPIRGRQALPWIAACSLLLSEYLFTTFAINMQALAERADWLAELRSAGTPGPILLAMVTAALLVGGRPMLSEFRLALAAVTSARRSRAGRIGLVAVHGAAFAVFFALSGVLSRAGGGHTPTYPLLLVATWLASAIIASLALAHALLPLASLIRLLRSLGGVLAIAAALGLLAWVSGLLTMRFWEPLGSATVRTAAEILSLAGSTTWSGFAFSSPGPGGFTLAFEGFAVSIEPECSGYQGIGLLTILLSAHLWAFRSTLRFPRALALVPIGIGLSWLANVMRIAGLMLVGSRWSPEIALGGFHSKVGWVLFCGISLGLVALTQRTSLFSRRLAAAAVAPTVNPTAAYLTPLLALVGGHMVTGIFSTGFPLLYWVGILAGATMLFVHRREYPGLFRPSWSWEACGFGLAAFAIWMALEPAANLGVEAAWQDELQSLAPPVSVLWLTLRVLGSVTLVPLAEELAFRGYALRRLISADFTTVSASRFSWFSFLTSSAAFGLLHERWLAGMLAGMLFALAQYRRGRLTDAVLAHGVSNLLIAISVVGWHKWSLWA